MLAAGSHGRVSRCLGEFVRQRRGATAIEFALVAPAFLVLVLFIVTLGYVIVLSATLDNATNKAARQLKVGQPQTQRLSQSQFISQVVCANLPSLFDCASVFVSVQPVTLNDTNQFAYPNSYAKFENAQQTGLTLPSLSNALNPYCPGNGFDYILLQVSYPVNGLMGVFLSTPQAMTYGGQTVYVVASAATYRNEPFAPTPSC